MSYLKRLQDMFADICQVVQAIAQRFRCWNSICNINHRANEHWLLKMNMFLINVQQPYYANITFTYQTDTFSAKFRTMLSLFFLFLSRMLTFRYHTSRLYPKVDFALWRVCDAVSTEFHVLTEETKSCMIHVSQLQNHLLWQYVQKYIALDLLTSSWSCISESSQVCDPLHSAQMSHNPHLLHLSGPVWK